MVRVVAAHRAAVAKKAAARRSQSRLVARAIRNNKIKFLKFKTSTEKSSAGFFVKKFSSQVRNCIEISLTNQV